MHVMNIATFMDFGKYIYKMKPLNKKNNIIKAFNVKAPTPLLEFLFAHITNDSKNNIKRLLSRRQVLVNGAPITQFDFMLAKEDVVEISSVSVQRIDPPKSMNVAIFITCNYFISICKYKFSIWLFTWF